MRVEPHANLTVTLIRKHTLGVDRLIQVNPLACEAAASAPACPSTGGCETARAVPAVGDCEAGALDRCDLTGPPAGDSVHDWGSFADSDAPAGADLPAPAAPAVNDLGLTTDGPVGGMLDVFA